MPTSCECTSCQWIKNPSSVVGGILPVGKSAKWMVNHNQSSEAILGWLALQPVEHQSTLDRLEDDILDDLGSALGSVQRAMRMVWTEQFSDDPLVRVHTVSFMESEFDDPQQPYHFHIHFFLIPRSKYLGKLIRRRKPGAPDSEKQYLAWED